MLQDRADNTRSTIYKNEALPMWTCNLKGIRLALMLAASIHLIGCTTTSQVKPNADALAEYNLSSSRIVAVEKNSGDIIPLSIDNVSSDSISGHDLHGRHQEISTNEINHVKVTHYSLWKTTALTVGTLLRAPGVILEVLWD